jgi:hypothetical protein
MHLKWREDRGGGGGTIRLPVHLRREGKEEEREGRREQAEGDEERKERERQFEQGAKDCSSRPTEIET